MPYKTRWFRTRLRPIARPVLAHRLSLETLDDRLVPATLTVTTNLNTVNHSDGLLSLREALRVVMSGSVGELSTAEKTRVAGALGANDTILLQVNTTYSFARADVDNFAYGPNALPAITRPVAIDGRGATLTRSGTGTTTADALRFFYVSGGLGVLPAGSLTLKNLTLSNGLAKGGNATSGGGGMGAGGAIFSQGAVTLDGVLLTGNQAVGGTSTGRTDFNDPSIGGGGGIGEDAILQARTNAFVGSGGGFGEPPVPPFSGITQPAGGLGFFSSSGGGGAGFTRNGTTGSSGQQGLGGGTSGLGSGTGDGGNGAFAPDAAKRFGGAGGSPGSAGGNPGFTDDPILAGDGGGGGGGVGGGGGANGGGGGFGGGGGDVGGRGGFGGGGGDPFVGIVADGGVGGYGAGNGGFSGNSLSQTFGGGGGGFGGAVFVHSGTLNVINSTLAANTARGGNGFAGGSGLGGAVFNLNGSVNLTHATLTGNKVLAGGKTNPNAQFGELGRAAGADMYSLAYGNAIDTTPAQSVRATVNLRNSILASSTIDTLVNEGNQEKSGTQANSSTVTDLSLNLVRSRKSLGTFTGRAPLATLPADPLLGPLQNNGGPTRTMALSVGSPAINAGSAFTGIPTTDQRGPGFVRTFGGTPDLGAFEFQSLQVDNAADVDDGNFRSGQLTLREAVRLANTRTGADVITFAPTLTGKTITLGSLGELVVTDTSGPTRIAANLLSTGVILRGNRTQRVFSVANGATLNLQAVTLTGGGGAGAAESGFGGALYVATNGTANLTEVTVSGNSAANGGGVGNAGTLNVTRSTLSGNSASQSGGGVFNRGTVRFLNATLSGNSAAIAGGGLHADQSTSTLTNTTMTLNRSDADGNGSGDGGGIDIFGASVTLVNSIIAGNVKGAAGTNTPSDIGSGFVNTAVSFNNIIGDNGTGGAVTNGVNGNIVGINGDGTRPIATILNTTLAANGGRTKTHALVANSVALNAGSNTLAVDANGVALSTDQRGQTRKQSGVVDIGSVEGITAFRDRSVTSPVFAGNEATLIGTIVQSDPDSTFTLTVDWGDGTPVESHTFPPGSDGTVVTLTHRYLIARTTPYPIKLDWRDPFGVGNSDQLAVTVRNPTPGIHPSPILLVSGPADGRAIRYESTDGRFAAGPEVDFFPGSAVVPRIAVGDVTGDGVSDFIGGTSPGLAAEAVVFNGATGIELTRFRPFGDGFTGGVYLAAADFTGDGRAEVVVIAGETGAARVMVFDGATLAGGSGVPTVLADFYGLASLDGTADVEFRGGGHVAVGDADGDGVPDLAVAAGVGGGPRVTVWSGAGIATAAGGSPTSGPVMNLFVFEEVFTGGVFVALGDVTGDGRADLIVGAGTGGGPRVRVVDVARLLALPQSDGEGMDLDRRGEPIVTDFFDASPDARGGVRVATGDADGDDLADLVTGSGDSQSVDLRVYLGIAIGTARGSTPSLAQDPLAPFDEPIADGVFVG